MACWRMLELTSAGPDVPQLLIKPSFTANKYTVFLTDLSNIWSEELNLAGIVSRASELESPIEVSKQDTKQLSILLETLQKSLIDVNDTVCQMTRRDAGAVTLHTSIRLPEPLDSLSWKFYMEKQTSTVLKDELILPLLVAGHIQHQRVNSLATIINDKDRAITRLIDQYESSHLDLASAFPSIGGNKPGRKLIKREQAAKHIPALVPFQERDWKQSTSQLQDTQACTLELFQEALSECNPKVPGNMKTGDKVVEWWSSIHEELDDAEPIQPANTNKSTRAPVQAPVSHSRDESETEDEFETHENFKLRSPRRSGPGQTKSVDKSEHGHDGASTTDDGDEDLDRPVVSSSQSQSRNQEHDHSPPKRIPTRTKSPHPQNSSASRQASSSPMPSPQPKVTSSSTTARPKTKGFRIGGKAKKSATEPSVEISENRDEEMADAPHPKATTPTKRKAFKIGGKAKSSTQNREESDALTSPSDVQPPPPNPVNQEPPAVRETLVKDVDDEEHEETPEEKAERKRQELKRKNNELAKKQAQKKKKRF